MTRAMLLHHARFFYGLFANCCYSFALIVFFYYSFVFFLFFFYILRALPKNVDFSQHSIAFVASVSYCTVYTRVQRVLAAHSEPFNAPCVKGKQAAE